MRVLELFSGTKSIGKAFPDDEVISVDLDPHFNPTHLCSIFDFDYKQYDSFDYIHASPPCRWYSVLNAAFYGRNRTVDGEKVIFTKEIHKRKLEEESDKLVQKALEIIDYFHPKCWTMENPYCPRMWNSLVNRPIVDGLPYTIVDYCMYDYPVKKQTILFNNMELELKTCDKSHNHYRIAHKIGKTGEQLGYKDMTLYERYRIPHALCLEISAKVKNKIETLNF